MIANEKFHKILMYQYNKLVRGGPELQVKKIFMIEMKEIPH